MKENAMRGFGMPLAATPTFIRLQRDLAERRANSYPTTSGGNVLLGAKLVTFDGAMIGSGAMRVFDFARRKQILDRELWYARMQTLAILNRGAFLI